MASSLKNPYFHSMVKKQLWKAMATVICLGAQILQTILFCVQKKKEIHTGAERH